MNDQELLGPLIAPNTTKLVLVVLDGVGGMPIDGVSELEGAKAPNLSLLAAGSACGLQVPVAYGITPGSGPGHLGIFGYDPLEWEIGRGVLEALGLGIHLTGNDIAVRCNYATAVREGTRVIIKDRRAGRIPTDHSAKITGMLQEQIRQIDDAQVILLPGMEHRFALVLRFPSLLDEGAGAIEDTDPQKEGLEPVAPSPSNAAARHVAGIALGFVERAARILKDQETANYVLLRGFSSVPRIPRFNEVYGLKSLAIATYPMYLGLAKLIGMDTLKVSGGISEEIRALGENYDRYDFFYVHIKKTDSNGEDGNFRGKCRVIEEFDAALPGILSLGPDVLVITGDHSTPALIKGHSWHPVPVLLKSRYVFGKTSSAFTERECLKGELGILHSTDIMPLMLANGMRLKKFGA
ncbi:MAG: 2,3-bisphosphoglycerate-independent phosphoglycerate mutase [Deltaproteobacteria bacterium]|nr:2,3-bisphosphoglycerate-independent phosphoglycerate mutase [Deltaproteobacteria bacterium]MCL5277687.1 2,3-bisphosphoglycerate-independent phosphoglycerate mutase [Deltaproteobacteria bacterium]